MIEKSGGPNNTGVRIFNFTKNSPPVKGAKNLLSRIGDKLPNAPWSKVAPAGKQPMAAPVADNKNRVAGIGVLPTTPVRVHQGYVERVQPTPTTPKNRVSDVPETAKEDARRLGIRNTRRTRHPKKPQRLRLATWLERQERDLQQLQKANRQKKLPEVFCATGDSKPSSEGTAQTPKAAKTKATDTLWFSTEPPSQPDSIANSKAETFEDLKKRLIEGRKASTLWQQFTNKPAPLKYPYKGKMVYGGGPSNLWNRLWQGGQSIGADKANRPEQKRVAGGFLSALADQNPELLSLYAKFMGLKGVEALGAIGQDLKLFAQALGTPMQDSMLRHVLNKGLGTELGVLHPKTKEEKAAAKALAEQQAASSDITDPCNEDLLTLAQIIRDIPVLQEVYLQHIGETAWGLSGFIPTQLGPLLNLIVELTKASERLAKITFQGLDTETVKLKLNLGREKSVEIAAGLASIVELLTISNKNHPNLLIQPWGVLVGMLKVSKGKGFDLEMEIPRDKVLPFVQALVDCDFQRIVELGGNPTLSAGNGHKVSMAIVSEVMMRAINSMGDTINQGGAHWLRRQLGVIAKFLRFSIAKNKTTSVSADGQVRQKKTVKTEHLKPTCRVSKRDVQTGIFPSRTKGVTPYGIDDPLYEQTDPTQGTSCERDPEGLAIHQVSVKDLLKKRWRFTKAPAWFADLQQAKANQPDLLALLATKKGFKGKVHLRERDGKVEEITFSREGVKAKSPKAPLIIFRYASKKAFGVVANEKIIFERNAQGDLRRVHNGKPLATGFALDRVSDVKPLKPLTKPVTTGATPAVTKAKTPDLSKLGPVNIPEVNTRLGPNEARMLAECQMRRANYRFADDPE